MKTERSCEIQTGNDTFEDNPGSLVPFHPTLSVTARLSKRAPARQIKFVNKETDKTQNKSQRTVPVDEKYWP